MDEYPDSRATWVRDFEAFGLHTLNERLYEYMLRCRHKLSNSSAFQEALKMADRNRHPDLLALYLGRINPSVLTAFILGKATAWSHHDAQLESALQEHSLKQAPMVYINVICRPKYLRGPSGWQLDRFAGYSVSVRQLEQVLDIMSQYTDISTPAGSLVHDIDSAVSKHYHFDASKQSSHLGARRFLPSNTSLTKTKAWIKEVKRRVVVPSKSRHSTSPAKLNEPMEWCFQELGFSRKGAQRANDHAIQEGTNYLLGLFYATLVYCFKDSFEMRQYRWSYVAEPDHANFIEIVGSILNGTYGLEADGMSLGIGLNPALAGGMPMKGPQALTDPKLRPGFVFAQQELAGSAFWQEHLDRIKSSATTLSDALSKHDELLERQEDLQQVKEEKQRLVHAAQQQIKSNLLSAVATLRARQVPSRGSQSLTAHESAERDAEEGETS